MMKDFVFFVCSLDLHVELTNTLKAQVYCEQPLVLLLSLSLSYWSCAWLLTCLSYYVLGLRLVP